ncbi:MAG TPA: acyl-CoA desaturase [Acidimicrobiia bacterium]|nr:acyl-CoA desaturase [Acidimicrobiia bacterium]
MAATMERERFEPLVRAQDERVNWKSSIPFLLVHALPLLVFVTGVSTTAIVLFLATYFGRMFFVTAAYHRYFAHKAFRMGRIAQFVFAFGGATAAQKGPLWWAAHHRNHHKFSDTERDIHSPRRGFWWSHVGWILCDKYNETQFDEIKDFARFPELRWIEKNQWLAPWTLGVACALIGGWSGLVFGFFFSTVLLWHTTFLVNSLAHVFGRRPYATDDTSRNSLTIALLTGGEGWHNNHHRYASSARQGFRWWQIDTTYYVLWLLARVGIVRDLRPVPARVIDEARQER